MRIVPVAIPFVTIATCSIILATPSAEKRLGFFSCTGWGAGCSSSWRMPKPLPKPQPPPKKIPIPANYWLTTGNRWGPPGKRSSILRHMDTRSSDSEDASSLPSTEEMLAQLLQSKHNTVFTRNIPNSTGRMAKTAHPDQNPEQTPTSPADDNRKYAWHKIQRKYLQKRTTHMKLADSFNNVQRHCVP